MAMVILDAAESLKTTPLVDPSPLSTPELSSPSGSMSSNDGSSFFSAVSSDDTHLSSEFEGGTDRKPVKVVVDSQGSLPVRVEFPSIGATEQISREKKPQKMFVERSTPHRPDPLPIFDVLCPPPALCPPTHHPRKLRKSRPAVSRLSTDTLPSPLEANSTLSHISHTPLLRSWRMTRTTPPPSLGRRATSQTPITPHPVRRPRRNSLPCIPTTTFGSNESHYNLRIVKFESPVPAVTIHRQHMRSPYPDAYMRSTSTDALVSLAWTGELPSAVTSSTCALSSFGESFVFPPKSFTSSLKSGWHSTWSLSGDGEEDDNVDSSDAVKGRLVSPISPISFGQRQLRRKEGKTHRRRWTLAMAITDEAISDEALVEELEKLRMKEKMWQWEWKKSPASPLTTGNVRILKDTPSLISDKAHQVPPPLLSDPLPSAKWQSARRTMLICRELVRTERHYLSSISALHAGDTTTPAPALMQTYLPSLVKASEGLLSKMEMNPSAQGVSQAFLSLEQDLEHAFVGWCGVVGTFFTEGGVDGLKEFSRTTLQDGASEPNGIIKRRVGSWGKRINSIKALGSSSSVNLSLDLAKEMQKKERPKHTVRDLAILPSQRVMRYALLYKDLQASIPSTTTSHKVVERAMQAAINIAQKSDRAQGNSAFLRHPS